jgi:hypothetical protein
VAAAGALLSMAAGGAEGAAAVQAAGVAARIPRMMMDADAAGGGGGHLPPPLEVIEELAQLLERLWGAEQLSAERERLHAEASHAATTSSAAKLARAEAAMEERDEDDDVRTEYGIGIIPRFERQAPADDEATTTAAAAGASFEREAGGVNIVLRVARLTETLKRGGGGGAADSHRGQGIQLPLRVRVALVAGGVMQPLWALFGRDRGEHVASLLMSPSTTTPEAVSSEPADEGRDPSSGAVQVESS